MQTTAMVEQIETNHWAPGIYLVNIAQGDHQVVVRLAVRSGERRFLKALHFGEGLFFCSFFEGSEMHGLFLQNVSGNHYNRR